MKIRAIVTALVLATVSGVSGSQVSTFTGLPEGETFTEFVKKMDQSPTAFTAFSNRIGSGITSQAIGTDPADAGAIRLENEALIAWEASPAGTDITLSVNTQNLFYFSAGLSSPTLVQPLVSTGLTASGASANDFSGSTGTFLTSTGVGTLGGTTTVAANKNFLCASGTSLLDFSLGTGIFKTTTGVFTISGAEVRSTDTLSGAGAVSVTKCITKFTSTGGSQALTLADGVDGQVKTIIHDVDGGSGILTPTTKTGFTQITFTAVGETATLVFVTTRGWMILSIVGAVAS